MLVNEDAAPEWFPRMEYIAWSGQHKDLQLIPHAAVARSVLVDDFEGYVLPGQETQWVSVLPYAAPYSDNDVELSRIRTVLIDEWGCAV